MLFRRMLNLFIVLAVMAVVLAPAALADAKPGPVTQPVQIPGEFDSSQQPFPPLEQIIESDAPSLPVYGLYSWRSEYLANRESIKKVGWKSIRFGGDIDDNTVKAAAEDGIEMLVTLGVEYVTNFQKKTRADFASDEEFIDTYVSGVVKFLERYGPNGSFFLENPALPENPVRFIEVLNEPNFQYMIPDREPRSEVEAEREALYAKLLPAVYSAVKSRWPDVTVVGFSAGGSDAGDIRFVQHVFERGGKQIAESFDVLSTHPYTHANPPGAFSVRGWGKYSPASSLESVRKILAANGAGEKPIWYTEIGWPVSKEDGGVFNMDSSVTVPPLLQAAYVTQIYALSMRLGVERTHIMFATDTDGFNGGVFLRDKSWRPSAYAVQNMIRLLPNPKIVGAISDGVSGYYAYQMKADVAKPDSPQVVMAWNETGPKTVQIPVEQANMAVVDMLGNVKTVTSKKDGSEYVLETEVGPCPVYILSPEAAPSDKPYEGASDWAIPELNRAVKYGLVTDRIRDDMSKTVTREEFAEVAVKLYEKYTGKTAEAGNVSFADTKNYEIYKAANLGLVAGVGDNMFAPDEPITREQMAVILFRALKVLDPLADYSAEGAAEFADSDLISQWAREAVAYCAKTKIMGGIGDNLFDPQSNASREQAVIICMRAYEYI